MAIFMAIFVGLIPMIPAVIFFIRSQGRSPVEATSRFVLGLKGFNIIVGLMAAGLGFVWLASPGTVMAAGLSQTTASTDPYVFQPVWPVSVLVLLSAVRARQLLAQLLRNLKHLAAH